MVNVPPLSSSGVTLFCRVRRGQVGDLLGQPGDAQVAGVLDHRDQQALLGVHGDADVLGARVGDLARLGVDGRVDLRVDLERLDRRLGDERQVGQARALPLLEVVLGLGPDPGDRGEVDLDGRGQLGGDLQRLDHPLGDGLAQPGHLLGGAAQGAGSPPAAAAAAGAAAGWRLRAAERAPRRPSCASSAAASTSCLRTRPPTPVPVTEARSTPCSLASLRTSGVT